MSTENVYYTSTSSSSSNTVNSNVSQLASISVSTSESTSTNNNNNNNTSTSTSTSKSENTENSFVTSTSTATSNSTSNNTNTNVNQSTSNSTSNNTETSYVTSTNTSNTTSNNVNVNTSNSTETSTVTTNSTSVNTSNSTNNSPSDVQVAQTNLEASEYQADQTLAGVNAHETAETLRLNLKLAFANDKFNAILPILETVAGTGTSSGGSGGGMGFHGMRRPIGFERDAVIEEDYTMGHYSRSVRGGRFGHIRMGSGDVKTGGIGFASGSSVADAVAATQLPFIRTCGVLTPSQVQASVNAAYARNDARTQAEMRRLVGDMTGRGFSPSSPILAALQVGLAGQNLRATLEGATQIQLESAKLNAGAILDGQKALSDQFKQQEDVLLNEQQNDNTLQVGMLNAVAQIVSGSL